MKVIFKVLSLILGLLAGMVARRISTALWGAVDDEEPPAPTTRDAPWAKVLAAATLKAAVLGLTKAVVQRTSARGFARLTGAWPGEEKPEAA